MKTRFYRRKNIYAGILIAVNALALTGCAEQLRVSDPQDEYVVADEGDLIVVGVSQVGSESVWRTANTVSIQEAFTNESGYFLLFSNARQKQENQIKAIRRFISRQVDYIVFSPITESGWDVVLQEARDAEIPVILMDRQVDVEDDTLYTAWVGSDFHEEGKNAGKWLEGYLERQGRQEEELHIVVLQGTEGATSAIGRTEGFQEIADVHDNWIILEQVDAEYTTAKGREVMEKLLDTYEDIDVVISQNDDMTFGALDAMNRRGITTGVEGDVIVVSFDAVKAALKLVEQGIINVDIECNPKQGEWVERVVRALERGEDVEKTFYIEEQIFTPENVSEYLDDRDY
ncbi:MAG: ABC transporter substrate-binding protein [bacterium]|nr:ABC transporter substrate-binding protein [bacterium]MCM1374391.1 ABC transporter substrate-binding protein [Muribaculum sp.]